MAKRNKAEMEITKMTSELLERLQQPQSGGEISTQLSNLHTNIMNVVDPQNNTPNAIKKAKHKHTDEWMW